MKTKQLFNHLLLLLLLFTSLGIFNGCRFLGFRDKSNEQLWDCEEIGYDHVFIDQKVRDLENELELLKKSLTNQDTINFQTNQILDINKTQDIFSKSFFKFFPSNDRVTNTIIFIAHEDNFEGEFQAFRIELSSLEGVYKLYIYLETPNLLYVEKITGEIIYSKVTLSEISIHSNEPSWYYIKGKGTVKSVYLTDQHEVMGIEKALTVENIYIHSTERLKTFTCNMDSTRLFYTNGTIRDNSVFPNLFDKPSKLKKIDMRNSE
jgi:hypothetical protein